MEVLKINSKTLKKAVKTTALAIKEGKVVVCPTDTVYGLLADADNKIAVRKIFRIKKRRFQKPLPLFVRNLRTAKKLAYLSKSQEKFLGKVWPGKVTVILEAQGSFWKRWMKDIILGQDKTVGLRIPNHKFLNALLKKIDSPLAETSANISGQKPSTRIKEALKQFKNRKYRPDLIVDAGNLKLSLPSTVFDLVKLQVSREGDISKKEIFKIYNSLISK
jgi:L-threonylcarbamoyladenylate synthase